MACTLTWNLFKGVRMFNHKTQMRPFKHFRSFCFNKIVNLKPNTETKKKPHSSKSKPSNKMNCN